MKANDYQIGGTHYQKLKIQPWDYMEATFTHEEFRGFLRGNIIKYLSRYKSNPLEDLKKAHHYLTKLIEVMEKCS